MGGGPPFKQLRVSTSIHLACCVGTSLRKRQTNCCCSDQSQPSPFMGGLRSTWGRSFWGMPPWWPVCRFCGCQQIGDIASRLCRCSRSLFALLALGMVPLRAEQNTYLLVSWLMTAPFVCGDDLMTWALSVVLGNKKACLRGRPGDGVSQIRCFWH